MTSPSCVVLDRLRAVDWSDADLAFDHANSRGLLMREYLRRAALWARRCGVEAAWPFFDIAEHVDPTIRTPDDVAAELDQFVRQVGPSSVARTCRGAVRWAGLPARGEDDLPDPYEPLIILYERGGGFYVEEFVDLNGVMIRLGDVESNASATPFLTLRSVTLDALDAEGEITYYARVGDGRSRDNPAGIVRRRIDDGLTHDEAFTSNFRWEPTEYLALHDLGHNDDDHVRITEIEAAPFVERATSAPWTRGG